MPLSLLPIRFLHDSLWRQKKFFYMQQHMKNYFVLQKFQTSEEVSLVLNTTITFFFFKADAISNFVSLNQVRLFLSDNSSCLRALALTFLMHLYPRLCIFFFIQHRGTISQWPVLTMVSLLILRILLFSILFGHLIHSTANKTISESDPTF